MRILLFFFCFSIALKAFPLSNKMACNLSLQSTVVSNVTCANGKDGSATVTANGGIGGSYTYYWTNGSYAVTTNSSMTVNGLAAGGYLVAVFQDSSCYAFTYFTLSELSSLNTLTLGGAADCGTLNGGAITFPSGNNPPFTYLWSTGASTSSVTSLPAGSYTVTITDALGCTKSDGVIVNNKNVLTAADTILSNVTCNEGKDGSVKITISNGSGGPYTYSWSNGIKAVSSSPIMQFNALAAGNYAVTLTENYCSYILPVKITEPSPVSALMISTPSTCTSPWGFAIAIPYGGSGSGYSYSWSTGSTNIAISGLATGIYTVTVSDGVGCSSSTVVAVNPNGHTAKATAASHVKCFGGNNGSAVVNATGGTPGYTYVWSNGNLGPTVSGLSKGTYSVTVLDANACLSVAFVTISQPKPITINVSSTPSICGSINGTATATAAGGQLPYTYLWNTGSKNQTIMLLPPATYTVTVSDANGCKNFSTVSVGISNNNAFGITGTPPTCNKGSNGSAGVTISGGTTPFSYTWSNGSSGTSTITGLTAGTYSVTVSSANGCTSVKSVYLTEPPPIIVSATPSSTGCGTSNGSIVVSVSGNTGINYSYTWTNGASGQTISGLSAGIYTVTVTDNKGCTNTASAIVGNSNGGIVSISTRANVSCYNGNDGMLKISVTGASASVYSYSWSTGSSSITSISSNTLNGLSAATYTVTVMYGSGCKAILIDSVTQPAELVSSILSTNVSSAIACDGSITASPSGGTSVYTYQWSNSATGQTLTGLCSGTYYFTLTDGHSCTFSDSVSIGFFNNDCLLHIYNMITPNNDGNNDYWFIDCIADFPDNHVEIFNRWGNKIWETDKYDNAFNVWEGKNKSGTVMPEGTYFYVIKLDKKEFSGKIELLK